MKKESKIKDAAEKAKTHTTKVATVAQTMKEKEAQDLKMKEEKFEQKLKNALNRRDTETNQKIQKAKEFQVKRNPSTSQEPK